VFAALNADIPRYYVGNDVHPILEGLRVIGETFYNVIRDTLDVTPPTPPDAPNGFGPSLFTRPSAPAEPVRRTAFDTGPASEHTARQRLR
jgi:hypothetical protein